MLAGVLVFGTPAGVLAEEADHSMEGQISKPQSSGESDTEGLPTTRLLPITTAFLPVQSIP